MVWGMVIVGYLFLAGLGAGACAAAAWLAWRRPEAARTTRAARLIAPIAVAVGLVLLVVDASAGLRNPGRFLLLVSNLSSVMAWGVIILVLFMVASIVALVLCVRGKRVPRALDAVSAVFSLAVAVYTGVLLGAAQLSFPLWNPLLLPVLFAVSALSTGLAAVMLYARIAARGELEQFSASFSLQTWLPVAEIVLVAALLAATAGAVGSAASAAGAAGVATVRGIVSGPYAVTFWAGLVAIGLVLPAVLGALEGRPPKGSVLVGATPLAAAHAGDGSASAELGEVGSASAAEASFPAAVGIVAEAAVLIGGLMLRYLVVVAALPLG